MTEDEFYEIIGQAASDAVWKTPYKWLRDGTDVQKKHWTKEKHIKIGRKVAGSFVKHLPERLADSGGTPS